MVKLGSMVEYMWHFVCLLVYPISFPLYIPVARRWRENIGWTVSKKILMSFQCLKILWGYKFPVKMVQQIRFLSSYIFHRAGHRFTVTRWTRSIQEQPLSAWETFRRGPTSHNECSNHWWTQFCLDFHWFQAECHRISSWRILVSSKYSFRMLWDALGCCGNVIPYIPWCWQPWNNPWGARSKLELRWSQQRVGRGTTGTMGTTGTKSILDFFFVTWHVTHWSNFGGAIHCNTICWLPNCKQWHTDWLIVVPWCSKKYAVEKLLQQTRSRVLWSCDVLCWSQDFVPDRKVHKTGCFTFPLQSKNNSSSNDQKCD